MNSSGASAKTGTSGRSARSTRARVEGLYHEAMLKRSVALPVSAIGRDVGAALLAEFDKRMSGRCVAEGYVKPESIELVQHSGARLVGDQAIFNADVACLVCLPVEGMEIECIAEDVTKAGVRAKAVEEPSPVVVFVARDHNNTSEAFSNVVPGDRIRARVIGQRFELNDPYVSVIAEIS